MGKYLNLLQNLSRDIEPLNVTKAIPEDLVTDMITNARVKSDDYLGLGLLGTFWLVILQTMLSKTLAFDITKTQALLSTSTLVNSIAIYFVIFGILGNAQFYTWFFLLNLGFIVLSLSRYS